MHKCRSPTPIAYFLLPSRPPDKLSLFIVFLPLWNASFIFLFGWLFPDESQNLEKYLLQVGV